MMLRATMKSSNQAVKRPASLIILEDIQASEIIPFIKLAHNPSVHAYHTLKAQIEQCSPRWLAKFLDLGGLDTFLDSLCQLTGHHFTNFSDAVLQLDCIGCVKTILNSPVGMQHMEQHVECVCKLLQAMDTPNTLPKKQLFELLTAIAMYSLQAHHIVLKALQGYKKLTNQHHVFSHLVNELKSSETATYRVTLMSFINVIIRGHVDVVERSRVREQFIALNLLEVMAYIRKDYRDSELAIQFELFDNDKHVDDEMLSVVHGVDVTNHDQLYKVLYSKVCLTHGSSHLLHILQDLVLLSSQSKLNDMVWPVLSQAVHHISTLQPDQLQSFSQDLHNLINSKIPQFTKTFSNHEPDSSEEKPTKSGTSEQNSSKLVLYTQHNKNDDSGTSSISSTLSGSGQIRRQDSGISVTSPYDNMPDTSVFRRQSSGRGSFSISVPQPPRKPHRLVKIVKWEALNPRDAQKPLSVWRLVTERGYRQKVKLDYNDLETEFEQTRSTSCTTDACDEIHLLESDEALRLNLLLARLEAMPEELAESVIEADGSDLTPGAMSLLLNAIPHPHQISRIQATEVPRFTLAPAEQFIASLTNHKDYVTLLHGLKFKVTFTAEFPKLKEAFELIITTCRDILHHHGLRDFIRVMLDAGNFLNAGNNIEPVGGIKLSSWNSLLEVKGQGHESNLLTYIMQQCESQDDSMLLFTNDFPALGKASGYCFDELKKRVTDLNIQMKHFHAELGQVETTVVEKYQDFIDGVKQDLASLHSSIARLKGLSSQMALYFCEEELNFDLQNCFCLLHKFITSVKSCQKNRHLLHEEGVVAAKHKKDLERKLEDAHIMKYFGKKADLCSSFARAQSDALVDHLLEEVHRGNIIHMQDEVHTPELQDKLVLSVIPKVISSPIDNLEIDLESSSFIFQAAGPTPRPTYADRMEQVTESQYHRLCQRETASFTTEGDAPCAENETLEDTLVSNYRPGALAERCADLAPSTKPANIVIYPKILFSASRRKHGHVRCKSDLDGSRASEENWKKYEMQKEASRYSIASDDLESSNMVASMGLETRMVNMNDVPRGNNRKVYILEPEKPSKDKKKKVSFFQRLSQAVLRPKNLNINQETDDGVKQFHRNSKRWSGRNRKSKKNSIDKENLESLA